MESGKEAQNNSERRHEAEQPRTSDEKSPSVAPRQALVEGNSAGTKKDGYFSKFGNWVSLLTLLFVAAYTVITFVQWRTNHIFNKKQLRSINAQLAEMRSSSAQTDQTISALQQQARTMADQLSVSRDEFTATQRPWISIDSATPSGPLMFVNNGSDIAASLSFVLTNSGHTPAVHVFPWVKPVLMTTGSLYQIVTETAEFCEERRRSQFSQTESGMLIAPNKPVTYPSTMGFQISGNDIRAGIQTVRGREAINPYIGGCISYEFTFGQRQRHETGFIYQFGGPETFIFLDTKHEIPADKLWLVGMDGGWAD